MTAVPHRVSVGGPRPVTPAPAEDVSGGWRPVRRLGAQSAGGLALPPARPTASWLYSPRGVFLGDDLLVVADSGNHRVLLWHGLPTHDGAPADVVLGQPDATSDAVAAGGDPTRGLHLPTGVTVHEGRLVVADAWHHRVLVWDAVPQRPGALPDVVLGQPGPSAVLPNRGGRCSAATLTWPYGLGVVDGTFWVTDTGNRRVLGWRGGVPDADRRADVVLGQRHSRAHGENRGEGVGPASFRWPHAVAGLDGALLVADAGNHRVLGWSPPPTADRPADRLQGQPDLTTAGEWPYGDQRPDRLRFPYGVACDPSSGTAVADTANNRVLLWDGAPDGPAQHVLGQPSFATNGENRWVAVTDDSLCWPYGLALRGNRLAVADSGNNRVVLWERR